MALIPLLGIIAYCLLRPPLLQIDRDEQELEIALKQRELMKYGECANCGYPVEADFVLCPNCHQRLKNLCGTCNHALDPSWTVCPYCPRCRRSRLVYRGGFLCCAGACRLPACRLLRRLLKPCARRALRPFVAY